MTPSKAKYFAQQLGSLFSLYLALGFFLGLVFGLVNLYFADVGDTSWQQERYQDTVRLGFAMTVVFFPTYLYLTRLVNQCRRLDTGCEYLNVTKWLIYLSLLVAGGVFLITLVTTIVYWLQGEASERFLLKVAAVLLVSASVFLYYRMDATLYWLRHPWASILCGTVSTIIILLTLVVGVTVIDSPNTKRQQQIDQQQVSDLQDMQRAIIHYLVREERLPAGIGAAYDGQVAPSAPEGRSAYRYELTLEGFNLCAEFKTDTTADDFSPLFPYETNRYGPAVLNRDDWRHPAGMYCFERPVQF